MNETEPVYTSARRLPTNLIPDGVLNFLNGEDLPSKTEAVRLSTVDADGWSRAALLSAGDVLAFPNGRLRFMIFGNSGTTCNLLRDGRLTISLSLDGGICSLRLRACKCGQGGAPAAPFAFFEATVEEVRMHVAPYAEVTGGISFALHEPAAVVERWQRQIAALRAGF